MPVIAAAALSYTHDTAVPGRGRHGFVGFRRGASGVGIGYSGHRATMRGHTRAGRTLNGRGGLGRPGTVGRIGLEQLRDARDRERIRADQNLMAAIAAGDTRAFARVVAEVSPQVLRFARSILVSSPGEAEEVLQEALLRLWQQAEDWQPQGRISTWLHRVTYRLCIDCLRRHRPSVALDDVEAVLADAAPSAIVALTRLDDVRAVQAAVAALPPRQRTAVVLFHYQGLGQTEAAAVMGIGERAYESLLARGRRALRISLSDGETQ